MSTLSLRLEKKAAPQREVVAWFLSGQSSEEWLAALSRWSGVQSELRLYVVPRGGNATGPEGLLIIPPAGARPPEGWRGNALGAIEQRCFLPVDADLFPPVAPAEVKALCRAVVTFFHPGIGVVEFGEGDVRRVWDFLEPVVRISVDWNSARSEPPLNSSLRGVALEALPGEDEIFGDAAKEIGASPPTELPSRRQEPSDGVIGKAGRTVAALGAGAVAKMMSWIIRDSPGTSSGSSSERRPPSRNWMGGLMDWATAKLAKISQEMEELRHRELHRLMDMLNSDPERGLRHALPLAGDPGRGRATPGARLGERDIRFNLSGSGGGASDPWDVPWELRQKLMARYRELAQQERQLGRFQRAAYIYAQLLGDWTAAVAALKEGGHFAEAAVVFRDRLLQPRAAAECFAAAGLFREAIAIYEKEKMFLELGDLQRKLGNEEAACEAYWRVVEEKTSVGDLLGAAGLLEVQLQLPDNALTMLGKAWPGTPQAAQCLTEQFSLLSRLGRHEGARARVVELRDERTPPPKMIGLAEVLAKVCKTYPDRSVRPLAADVARVKVGARLKLGDAAEAKAGTRILSELAPEDRLLARDASRFLANRLEALARRTAPPPRKPGSKRVGVPVCSGGFALLGVKEVLTVTRLGSHYLAAVATRSSKTEIVRGNWEGSGERAQQSVVWTDDQLRRGQIALIHGSHGPVTVVTSPKLLRKEIVLPASAQFIRPLPLSAQHWLPEGFAAMALNAGHCWILRNSNGEWLIDIRSANGYLSGEFSLQAIIEEIPEPVNTVAMLAVRSQVWIALGRYLFQFEQPRRPSRRWVLETPIIGLEPMAPLLAAGVVARCEQGAAAFWCDHLNEVEMIATDLAAPFCAPLGNGMMAFLSSQEGPEGFAGQVVDTDRRGVHSQADFQWKASSPVGLVAMPQPNSFAVFGQDGKVQAYEVPTVG